MQCDRLISLIKGWYLKVQEEAMAPARMVAFMEKHISQCEECLADPDVKQEVEKIREIVLPPPKAPKPKVVRVPKEDVEGDKEDVEGDKEVEKEETSEGEENTEDGDEVDDEVNGSDDEDTEDTEEDDEELDPDIIDADDEI